MLWNAETLTGEISAIRTYKGKKTKNTAKLIRLECRKQIQTAFFLACSAKGFLRKGKEIKL